MVFLLSFIIFLVVFGGICLWAVIKINEERRAVASSTVGTTSQAVQFDETDARNLLVVTTDQNSPQGFVIVRADPAKARILTLAVPRDTVVDYGTREVRLHELTAEYGIPVARDSISKLFNVRIDNFIEITYDNIEKMVNYFESGIIMQLNEDLDHHDESLSISIDGGLRTLTASQVVKVLRYPSWRGGRKQRADIQAQLTSALINQYMRSLRKDRADDDFSYLVNLAKKTDILVSHYISAKTGLDYLAERNDGSISSSVSLPGEYKGSGDAIRYYAADDVKKTLKAMMGW